MFTIQKALTDVHSLVSEEFNGFIETRVKEATKSDKELQEEKQKFNDDKKSIIDNLLKLAIDLNGINDSLNDPESKSDELFEIIQRLSEMK